MQRCHPGSPGSLPCQTHCLTPPCLPKISEWFSLTSSCIRRHPNEWPQGVQTPPPPNKKWRGKTDARPDLPVQTCTCYAFVDLRADFPKLCETHVSFSPNLSAVWLGGRLPSETPKHKKIDSPHPSHLHIFVFPPSGQSLSCAPCRQIFATETKHFATNYLQTPLRMHDAERCSNRKLCGWVWFLFQRKNITIDNRRAIDKQEKSMEENLGTRFKSMFSSLTDSKTRQIDSPRLTRKEVSAKLIIIFPKYATQHLN